MKSGVGTASGGPCVYVEKRPFSPNRSWFSDALVSSYKSSTGANERQLMDVWTGRSWEAHSRSHRRQVKVYNSCKRFDYHGCKDKSVERTKGVEARTKQSG